ncbi:hypothetical protein THIOM_001411 [Candidatus Thiomargarita nelsonii]|uniref:Uncharacterized protein n=1 Tax=Candidatus Thiomargarita nelsonii TaxID=1003181 RepID=A0A176S4B9_9GAMM|nr:hypothetical protein THIOM_001411 [Candidatus Thiomargarita nelsonii]
MPHSPLTSFLQSICEHRYERQAQFVRFFVAHQKRCGFQPYQNQSRHVFYGV